MEASLFPIIQFGKFGYIDEWGEVAIAPIFDVAKRFSEGLARVKLGAKWAFIDELGNIVIEPMYQLKSFDDNHRRLDFHEERAAFPVSVKDRVMQRWGCIDKTGEVVIPPIWDSVSDFSDGIAIVGKLTSQSEKRTGVYTSNGYYIDRKGQTLGFPIIGGRFSEGLAHFRIGSKNDHAAEGYIDRNGNVVIEPQRRICGRFSEGFARVRAWNRDEWGYIDKRGHSLCKRKFKNAGDFHEELARILVEDEKEETEGWGFLNQVGDIVIEPTFAAVGNFSNGVAAVAISVEIPENISIPDAFRCGYINRRGEWVIEPRFSIFCGDFQNELALVSEGEKWGYINQSGDYVWSSTEPMFLENAQTSFAGFSICRDADEWFSNFPIGFQFSLF